jgi:hypothetical protein
MNQMKCLAATLFMAIACCTAHAQTLAITEYGDSIYVYNDGTWSYLNEDFEENFVSLPSELPNGGTFKKPSSATSDVTGPDNGYKISFQPKEWKKIMPSELNDDASHAFSMVNNDGYAMLIYERIGIPLESLAQIAIDQAVSVAPNLALRTAEYRVVNGKKMLCMQMDGTMQGIDFTYYGYYYSDENRSIQFISYTGTGLFNELKDTFEQLLNGLEIP